MRFLLFLFVFINLTFCKNADSNSQKAASKDSTTIILLDSGKYNFGKIIEGQTIEFSFTFKNSGENPLIIVSVNPQCGCTVAEKPTQPILPGQTGTIKATFDSHGKGSPEGASVVKSITVISNATNWKEPLLFTGVIVKEEPKNKK